MKHLLIKFINSSDDVQNCITRFFKLTTNQNHCQINAISINQRIPIMEIKLAHSLDDFIVHTKLKHALACILTHKYVDYS